MGAATSAPKMEGSPMLVTLWFAEATLQVPREEAVLVRALRVLRVWGPRGGWRVRAPRGAAGRGALGRARVGEGERGLRR
jgi:hypothetical protein